jgi:hypothetical protein
MSAIPFVHGESEHESLNVGGRSFIQPHIDTLLNETKYQDRKHVMHAGSNPSATVATGMKASHIGRRRETAFSVTQGRIAWDNDGGENALNYSIAGSLSICRSFQYKASRCTKQ